jgi:hypothetical protein
MLDVIGLQYQEASLPTAMDMPDLRSAMPGQQQFRVAVDSFQGKPIAAPEATNLLAANKALINQVWLKYGLGSLDSRAAHDATNMMRSESGLLAFEQHLKDAHHVAGNPGVDAYVSAVNEQLSKTGAPYRVDMGSQRDGWQSKLRAGEYGTFLLKPLTELG